ARQEWPQGAQLGAERLAFGEVEVQPLLDRVRQRLQQRSAAAPVRHVDEAGDSAQATACGQLGDAARHAGRQAEVVGADGQRALTGTHAARSPCGSSAPRPASAPTMYTGRCLTSSKMRPTYSPRMPIDSSCTPLK